MRRFACTIPADIEDPEGLYKWQMRRRLDERKWQAAFNSQGQVDMSKVLRYVQKGGASSSIRGEVWEFLLGCFSPNSNAEQRKLLRESRREKYHAFKAECREIDCAIGSGQVVTTPRINDDGSPIEDYLSFKRTDITNEDSTQPLPKKIIQWKLILHQIGLDVVRTDRMLEFYEDAKNLGKLWDILAVYAWIDEEVGYCQGMSDLCSPLVILFPDEADAFWCFKCLMHRVRENFRCTNKSIGVQTQLAFLASTMQVVDPKLHNYLDLLGGGSYVFAVRMLMVVFRREFSFLDTLYLWEMMWALEYDPDLKIECDGEEVGITNLKNRKQRGKFVRRNIKYGGEYSSSIRMSLAVFCVVGILEMQRKRLMKARHGLDEAVKVLNEMSGKLDVKVACKHALKFHKIYLIKDKKLK